MSGTQYRIRCSEVLRDALKGAGADVVRGFLEERFLTQEQRWDLHVKVPGGIMEVVRGMGPEKALEMFFPDGRHTQDQIAAVMLRFGTPEQQKEALEYAGTPNAVVSAPPEERFAPTVVDEDELMEGLSGSSHPTNQANAKYKVFSRSKEEQEAKRKALSELWDKTRGNEPEQTQEP